MIAISSNPAMTPLFHSGKLGAKWINEMTLKVETKIIINNTERGIGISPKQHISLHSTLFSRDVGNKLM